jgi:hypothetical protein
MRLTRVVPKLVIALTLLFPSTLPGQDLEAGTKIRISAPRLTNPVLAGTLVRQTSDSLWIRHHDYLSPLQFSWSELSRLDARQRSPSRNRHLRNGAWLGILAGGVSGLIVGGAYPRECSDCLKQPLPTTVYTVPAGALLGAVLGMAVGAVTSPSVWVPVTQQRIRR